MEPKEKEIEKRAEPVIDDEWVGTLFATLAGSCICGILSLFTLFIAWLHLLLARSCIDVLCGR